LPAGASGENKMLDTVSISRLVDINPVVNQAAVIARKANEMLYPEMKSDSIRVLRSCFLLHDKGEYEGLKFVRCGRNLGWDGAHEIATNIREATGDSATQVCASHNPEGYNDYVRVSLDSRAYAFLCHLKS
jgi:hypothetical protein